MPAWILQLILAKNDVCWTASIPHPSHSKIILNTYNDNFKRGRTEKTLRGVVEFLWKARLKKVIKNLLSVPVNVLRKTRIGTNFSRRSRAIKFDSPCKVVGFGC